MFIKICLRWHLKPQKTWLPLFFVRCIIKKLLDSIFVISRIIKAVRVINLSLRFPQITSTSTLTIVDVTDTLSNNYLERFSFERRKVIGFAFTTLRDWLKKLAPLFHPIRSKTKTNRDSLVRVFPRFASATCNYFVFWLVHLVICVLCDWLEW